MAVMIDRACSDFGYHHMEQSLKNLYQVQLYHFNNIVIYKKKKKKKKKKIIIIKKIDVDMHMNIHVCMCTWV